jgi:cytochrome P450
MVPGSGASPLVLRLDGPDREAAAGHPARILAFGAGPRACPAPHHALAVAAAIVETLRTDRRRDEDLPRC